MRKPWTDEDIRTIRENLGMPASLVAEKLGRSVASVYMARTKFARDIERKPYESSAAPEFDTRSSGWYKESIGVMLIEYKPAYDSWKHYHRYVKVELIGIRKSALGGIAHVRCYRDAESE